MEQITHLFNGVPKDVFDITSVGLKDTSTLEVLLVVKLPDPHALVAPTRGQEVTGERPGYTFDLAGVPLNPPIVIRGREYP